MHPPEKSKKKALDFTFSVTGHCCAVIIRSSTWRRTAGRACFTNSTAPPPPPPQQGGAGAVSRGRSWLAAAAWVCGPPVGAWSSWSGWSPCTGGRGPATPPATQTALSPPLPPHRRWAPRPQAPRSAAESWGAGRGWATAPWGGAAAASAATADPAGGR